MNSANPNSLSDGMTVLPSITVWHTQIQADNFKRISNDPHSRQSEILERKKAETVVSRQLLRCLISDELKINANQLEIIHPKNQNPTVHTNSENISLTLSHDFPNIAVGIGRNCFIGIDLIRSGRNFNRQRIADKYFHPNELKVLRLNPDEYLYLFDLLWVLKESQVKLDNIPLLKALKSDFSDCIQLPLKPGFQKKINAAYSYLYADNFLKLGILSRTSTVNIPTLSIKKAPVTLPCLRI